LQNGGAFMIYTPRIEKVREDVLYLIKIMQRDSDYCDLTGEYTEEKKLKDIKRQLESMTSRIKEELSTCSQTKKDCEK
jgi:hypothetical protein